jgi:hypothetical protein
MKAFVMKEIGRVGFTDKHARAAPPTLPARPRHATLATLIDFSGDCPSMNVSYVSHEQQRHLLLASPAIPPF